MERAAQQTPHLPVKSDLRDPKFLAPLNTKVGLVDEQPPLSPSAPPHDVYLSSEEDASSSADEYSDYDYDSESEYSNDSPKLGPCEDVARLVSIVFTGKPLVVQVRSRSAPSTPETGEVSPTTIMPQQRSFEDLTKLRSRRTSVASIASAGYLSAFSRSSTFAPGEVTPKHAFLNTDPFARPQSQQSSYEHDRPRTPKSGSGSMLKRTLSLARKRSRPGLSAAAAADSLDDVSIRSMSIDETDEESEERHSAEIKASRRRTMLFDSASTPAPAVRSPPKGHSRLRSGLSISLGRRKN
jgi:hypothetical protein